MTPDPTNSSNPLATCFQTAQLLHSRQNHNDDKEVKRDSILNMCVQNHLVSAATTTGTER